MAFSIGDRIQCEGHRGTIRYIGEVPPTPGTWYGVDWDEPARGKHDGTYNGIRYFHTSHPTSGLFIRPNKCENPLDLIQALKERYLIEDDACLTDEIMLRELQGMMKASLLEVVGLEKVGKKQSNLETLQIAILDRAKINNPGPKDSIGAVCPNIQELNLAGNLLNSWNILAEITRQLPNLRYLNISENRLTIPEDCRELQPAFAQLRHLLLGGMNYTWDDIVRCSLMWPQLQILSVARNKITEMKPGSLDHMVELRELNLEGNSIGDWEQVNALGHLPNLEVLSLYDTGLKNIVIPTTGLFPKLTKLSLSNNCFSEWRCISELDKLAKLVDLKISGNPQLPADSHETKLQLIIARLGKLKVLNGSEISPEERRGAEFDYIKKYGPQYLASLPNLSEFFQEHPRYARLVEKYGPPEVGETEQNPATLRNTLFRLRLTHGSTVEKKLPSSLSVQKLRALCQRLFKIDNTDVSVCCISSKNPDVRIPLDNDLRPLSFFSVEDGDEIVIQSQ